MDHPSEEDEPEDGGQHEVNDGHQESSLNKLSQSGDKETTEGSDDVTGGTLASHGFVSTLAVFGLAREFWFCPGAFESSLGLRFATPSR